LKSKTKVNEDWVQVDIVLVSMDQFGKEDDVRAIPALAGGSANFEGASITMRERYAMGHYSSFRPQ